MRKSPDAFRTISEVSEWLDTPAHVLRFWESRFTQVKPVKRAGGRRYYRPADMLLLGGIKKLLHDDGLTIRGAQKIIREQGVKEVSALSQPLDDDGIVEVIVEAKLTTPPADEAPMAEDVETAPMTDNVVTLRGDTPGSQDTTLPAEDDAPELDFGTPPSNEPAEPKASTVVSEVEPTAPEPEATSAEPMAPEPSAPEAPLGTTTGVDTSEPAAPVDENAPETDTAAPQTTPVVKAPDDAPLPNPIPEVAAAPAPLGADLPDSDPDDDSLRDGPTPAAVALRQLPRDGADATVLTAAHGRLTALRARFDSNA